MTPERRELLRKWSAEKVMGWRLNSPDAVCPNLWWGDEHGGYIIDYFNWTPDSEDAPASQILGVIEAMRELGWELVADNENAFDLSDKPYSAEFNWRGEGEFKTYDATAATFPEAVLEAGYATGARTFL